MFGGVYREQVKGFYFNRASGGNCYHCVIDGDTDAGTKPGKETGKNGCLSDEHETMGCYLVNVLPRK
jgi:hypothetical protein